jgi:TPR repeat protein
MTGILASGNAAPEQTPAWTGRERGMRRGAACLAVARAFEAGDGIARDLRKAESWYEKGSSDSDECRDRLLRLRAARTADDPEELYAQGYRYIVGDGVAKDARKAAELFRKAADKGHAASMFNLGVCYEQGAGVPKNLGTAASLYRQAAEKGMMNAQYNYAVFLLEGRGVRKDRNAAVAWFRKAAAQGHDGAAKALRQLGQ